MTTFFIETNGDSDTISNSEQMAGLLQQAKFNPTETLEESDLVIFNNGSLQEPEESAFLAYFHLLDSPHRGSIEERGNAQKLIRIAGCAEAHS